MFKHDFSSINRFSNVPYNSADYTNEDKNLIDNWGIWYEKNVLNKLGERNAKK